MAFYILSLNIGSHMVSRLMKRKNAHGLLEERMEPRDPMALLMMSSYTFPCLCKGIECLCGRIDHCLDGLEQADPEPSSYISSDVCENIFVESVTLAQFHYFIFVLCQHPLSEAYSGVILPHLSID